LLLDYVVAKDRLWRFDMDRSGWRVQDLGPAQEVNQAIAANFTAMSAPGNSYRDSLEMLSATLLAGLQLAGTERQLLVSPGTALNNVPFSALLLEDDWLGDRVPVILVPSISEYLSAAPGIQPAREVELAVFADPDFGSITDPQALVVDQDSFRYWAGTLERLPASAREADSLAAWYPQSRSRIFTGNQANTDNLFAGEVRNAGILHLATHGYFNEALPELTGIAMSPGREGDSFVSLAELSGARFTANLVVISACSTTQGEAIPGEGNMSLGRAFLAQGVDSVISTLWPVSDRATAQFMHEFYRALNEDHLDYASAMQAAQQALRSSANYRNPYYWAAYVLTSAVPAAPAW
jgi:CHAT domain-containing protein